MVGTLPAPAVLDRDGDVAPADRSEAGRSEDDRTTTADATEADRREAEAGRITRCREQTREQRMRIAREAERRFGRKVAWGRRWVAPARCSRRCPYRS